MNILLLNHNVAWSGGTFFRALYIARHLQRRRHRCTLLTISKKNRLRPLESTWEGVRLIETPDLLDGIGRTGWCPWDTLWRAGWAWRRRREFDLIYAFDSRPAVILPAIFLKRLTGLPLIYDWCDWWGRGGLASERGYGRVDRLLGPVETWFEEHFRTAADATTVISQRLGQRAAGLGVAPASIFLIPQGCEPEKFTPAAISAARQRLGLPQDAFIAGYLGKLIASDQPFLVEAIRLVGERIPNFQVVHVGPPTANVPADLLFDGRFVQAGRVPESELGDYLSACDGFLLPLRDTLANNARWPSKINDYLAAGRPIVTTRVSDIIAYFDSRSIGYITDPTPMDFAEKIDLLYRCATREEMGRQARRLAETDLSWDRLVADLEQFIHKQIPIRSR